ncbi:ABC transporter permease [Microbacterium sp. MPKO10]|uniref:ABC transporter permease n=1 Tax=Microbacterium sp. MPKO10 TaxID=2989818 RepID=UPI0022360206|nr:ABC transporter permease [Microbacterium sp. MPKO10]MCW4457979.1 ABC transporter permease [Microbacterium sp. MPKO10]
MNAVFRHEMRANRKPLIGWSAVMVFLVIIGAAEYPVVVGMGDQLREIVEAMPRIMRLIFGLDAQPITTPLGYYAALYPWYALVACAHAAILGATIMAKEERDRTADFLFTKPFARSQIVSAKLFAASLNIITITLVTAALALVTTNPDGEITGQILLSMLGMLLAQLAFFGIAFLISAITQNARVALAISVFVVAIGYGLAITVEYVGSIDILGPISPFRYVPATDALAGRIEPIPVMIGLIVTLGTALLASRRWKERDLHA